MIVASGIEGHEEQMCVWPNKNEKKHGNKHVDELIE